VSEVDKAAGVIAEAMKDYQFERTGKPPSNYVLMAQALHDAGLLLPEGFVAVQRDDNARPMSDSLLPHDVIMAGVAVCDQMHEDNANYIAGETTDWDDGMLCVGIYRAMIQAQGEQG